MYSTALRALMIKGMTSGEVYLCVQSRVVDPEDGIKKSVIFSTVSSGVDGPELSGVAE